MILYMKLLELFYYHEMCSLKEKRILKPIKETNNMLPDSAQNLNSETSYENHAKKIL